MTKSSTYTVGACPACGATSDITCGTYNDRTMQVEHEHQAMCHGCGHEFNYNTGKALRKGGKGHTHGNTAKVQGVWLKPEVCTDDDQVFSVAFDGFRRRPVVAINDKKQSVVCSMRTARKHGWAIQGKLFGKAAEDKVPTPAPAPAKAKSAPAKAKAQPKAAAKRAARLESLEDLLG